MLSLRMKHSHSLRHDGVSRAGRLHIAIVTDAWDPQINGVVMTWRYVVHHLRAMGHTVEVISPAGSVTVPAPTEPGVRLCLRPGAHLQRRLAHAFGGQPPDRLHIATEGPLGWAARRRALRAGWAFTTSYHTRFPEYLAARLRIPMRLTYAVMRRFHAPSSAVLVPTPTVRRQLQTHGLQRVRDWTRGVDATEFSPRLTRCFDHLPRPVFLCVGRVAPEKNLESFLGLDLPGSKVVVGDGPARARLERAYPHVHWLGMRAHDTLPELYSAADVFVFPSRTDTFGLVNLEAMACGCPVAAFPVAGPIDVVTPGVSGVLHEDLRQACLRALRLRRQEVRRAALDNTWASVAASLYAAMVPCVPPVVEFRTQAPRLERSAREVGQG